MNNAGLHLAILASTLIILSAPPATLAAAPEACKGADHITGIQYGVIGPETDIRN